MKNDYKRKRINAIYRMLLEMATGNLSYRLKPDGLNKYLDQIGNMLNEVAAIMQSNLLIHGEFKIKKYSSKNDQEIELANKLHEFILNNLGKPLPSTKALSEIFETNEFTLKKSFRTILEISIYQFYNNERLKKAKYLIENTSFTLTEIALYCGFRNYSNFAKAFTKKYSTSPSNCLRLNNP